MTRVDSDPNILSVSVIVPTWGRPELLRKALAGLVAQKCEFPFEVIVVENGSTYTESVAAEFPAFRFLRLSARGVCAARNLGAQQARGSLLIFLDDDIVPCPDFIAAHVRVHSNSGQSIGVGNLKFVTHGAQACAGIRFQMAAAQAYAAGLLERGAVSCGPFDFMTGNFSIQRQLFFDLGGFDETFDPYGGEELDLALRLDYRGANFVFAPEAFGVHYGAGTEAAFHEKMRLTGRADLLIFRKHGHLCPPTNFIVGRYATWHGWALRSAFRYTPALFQAVCRALDSLAASRYLAWTPISGVACRFRREQALWTGVRDVIDWPELGRLIKRFRARAELSTTVSTEAFTTTTHRHN
jgi:glycosyltransferase involved in cell wall biosynthesis